MYEYSKKWHNGTSRIRSTKTFDGLAAIHAQLNNLGREIKKVNEKVYVAQVGCEQCKGPHYTKDCPLKEEVKRHEENSNMIKEIQASTDAAIQNQGALIKTLEIQIGQVSKELAANPLGITPTAHAKIDVFKRKITLRVGDEKIIFKSMKPASSLIKRVYMLGLRERMELDLEARLIGETLVLHRSLDPLYKDYIELNDLNVPLELRRDQVDNLMLTIEEVVENMNDYRDQDIGDIILREPFYKASCVEARRANPADIFTFVIDHTYQSYLIEEDTIRTTAEPVLMEYMEKAQAKSNSAKQNTDDNINIELSKEFLMELRSNAHHGMFDEDVVDHIANVLEILDLINIPGVDSHRLRMKVFPLSLADDARQCEDEMLDEGDNWGIDPLEFISRVNSSFETHMRVDGRTKSSWMNRSWNKRRMDDSILSNNKWKESDCENPPNTNIDSFFKPYLKTRKVNNIEKEDERSRMKQKGNNSNLEVDILSNMTKSDNKNIEQPNKRMCKEEKFEAIKYSLGHNEEYIAIRRCEYNA
ncbi:hypothetical protein Tco_1417196 [Tanacetum coccineum]